jgi:hypothetical protein
MTHYRRTTNTAHIEQMTNRLIPRNTVLFEKLTVRQPVKKFPVFYRTYKFITTFTKAHQLPLSSTRSIQFTHYILFLPDPLYIVLPSTPWFSKWSPCLGCPHQNPAWLGTRAVCPAHLIVFDLTTQIIFDECTPKEVRKCNPVSIHHLDKTQRNGRSGILWFSAHDAVSSELGLLLYRHVRSVII